jgi:hypothetical protein
MRAGMMQTLWEAAEPHLTDEQLSELCTPVEISRQLAGIAEVMEGIGCLVITDSMNKTGAGNFQQGDSVSNLLFTLSRTIRALGTEAFIESDAKTILQQRKEKATEAAQANGRKQRMAVA